MPRLSRNWGVTARDGGGRTRARTWDPLIKSQLLYQLSYASPAISIGDRTTDIILSAKAAI